MFLIGVNYLIKKIYLIITIIFLNTTNLSNLYQLETS